MCSGSHINCSILRIIWRYDNRCIILGFVNEMMSEAASGFIHSILFKQIKSKSLISREKINQAIVDLIDDALLFISSDYDVVFTVIFMPFMVNVKL